MNCRLCFFPPDECGCEAEKPLPPVMSAAREREQDQMWARIDARAMKYRTREVAAGVHMFEKNEEVA